MLYAGNYKEKEKGEEEEALLPVMQRERRH